MYISETTANERLTVERAVGNLFVDLEAACEVLNLLFNAHFDSFPQKELSVSEAATVGFVLHSAIGSIADILLAYGLTVGHDAPIVAAHMESMRRAEAALKTEELSGKTLRAVQRNESLRARRAELLSMSDKEAVAGLEKLLEEVNG